MASLKKVSRDKNALAHKSLHMYKLNTGDSIEELDDELSQKNKLRTPKRPKEKFKEMMKERESINIDLAETSFVANHISTYEQKQIIHNVLSNEALSSLLQGEPATPFSPNSAAKGSPKIVTEGTKLGSHEVNT